VRDGAGPDALTEPLDGAGLVAALGGKRAIKVALMDQDRLAGLGNIHAAEACFRAGVAPQRPGASLSPAEWERLAAAIVAQLEATLAGVDPAEELQYVSEGGDNPFAVYGREGEACPRCGGAVAAETQAGRTTFWCPSCQR
jgi:formamidopyrimidine-DNA glycosylase